VIVHKALAGQVVGVAAFALGVVEMPEAMHQMPAYAQPANLFAGGSLVILSIFAGALYKLAEKWLIGRIEDIPSKAQIEKELQGVRSDHGSLVSALEKLANAIDADRKETEKGRELLAATLANHGARLSAIDGQGERA